MNQEPKRLRAIISGRVQGVWYRASTRDQAAAYGLTGWVKNLPDGRVEAVMEGDEELLRQMLAWCWQGPPNARVDAIEESWSPATGEFKGFKVAY